MSQTLIPLEPKSLDSKVSHLNENPALIYLSSLASAHSRRNIQRYLNIIAVEILGAPAQRVVVEGKGRDKTLDQSFLNVAWEDLRFQHMAGIKALLVSHYAPATVNVMLSALRGVLGAAWKLELLSAEDYHRAIEIANVKATTLPAGRDVGALEIKALMETCKLGRADAMLKDIRDAALIALLYATGLRREEAANLEVSNYEPSTGRLDILAGKGHKDRSVYIKNRAQHLLDTWLAARGNHAGALWQPIDRWGKLQTERGISSQAIYNMLKLRGTEAGIAEFSPHDLRRTFVGNALDAGIDMATVANIAGHASTDTTRRYDRRGERAKEQAAHKIDLPI
jgi:site-specific recombinase XerD